MVGVTVLADDGKHYACAQYPSSSLERFWKCGCCRRGYVKPLPGFVCPACRAMVDSAFVWERADDSGEYKLAALLAAAEKKPKAASINPSNLRPGLDT